MPQCLQTWIPGWMAKMWSLQQLKLDPKQGPQPRRVTNIFFGIRKIILLILTFL